MAFTSIPGVADAAPGNVVPGLGADPYNGNSGGTTLNRTTQHVALALTSDAPAAQRTTQHVALALTADAPAAQRTTQHVALALTSVTIPQRTTQHVVLALTHSPPEDTCPTPAVQDDLCQAESLIVWAGIAWADGLLGEDYAMIDRPHPNSYFGGLKAATLLGVSECTRALTSHDGAYQAGRFAFVLDDTDRALRGRMKETINRHVFNRLAVIRAVSPEGEAAMVEPRVLGHGLIDDYQFADDGLSITFQCRDSISSTLGHFRQEGTFPFRTVTAADFPDCPTETIGAAVPVGYGVLSDEAEAAPVGVVQPIYVGTTVVASQTWRVLLIAGHAIKRILSWRYTATGGSTEVSQGEGTDYLVPGYSGWTTNVGAATYVDIGGHRYTYILARGPKGDAIAEGTATFAVNCEGIETIGNGTGDLIRDHFDMMQHFYNQWVATSGGYQTGLWASNPLYDTGTCKVNNASFQAAKAIKAAQVSGGFVGGGMYLGANGALETMRDVIAKWCVSGDCRIGQNDYWQTICVVLDTGIDESTLPIISDVTDIYNRSFRSRPLIAEIANATPYRYGPRYGAQATANPWAATGEESDATSQTYYGRIPRETVDLHGVRSSAVATNILQHRERRTKNPPEVRELEGSLCLDTYDLGSLARVTHFAGAGGSSGDANLPAIVIAKTINAERHSVRLVLEDVTDQLL